MLALTRKKGESLVINNNIEVTILEIYRKEVYLQIQEENKAALETNNAEALKNLF